LLIKPDAPFGLPLSADQWFYFVTLAVGAVLTVCAINLVESRTGRALLAIRDNPIAARSVGIDLSLYKTLIFGVSALYHRRVWGKRGFQLMRRLDHSMIFFLIAGTYTPFALLVLEGTLATVILVVVWAGALGGVLLKLVWIDAPKPLIAVMYVMLGWVAVAAFPDLVQELGVTSTALVVAGGLLYTAGAVVYALGRPDPVPTVFGYHEIFHALVIAAAALQYAVIAFFVLPDA
jgi:hemolysin III